MGHWGKIVGGGIGFMVGGPIGAAVGAGLGALTDESEQIQQRPGFDVICPHCRTDYRLTAGRWNCNSCSTDFVVTHCSSCSKLWTVSGAGWTCECGSRVAGPEVVSPTPAVAFEMRCPGCQHETRQPEGVWDCEGCGVPFRVTLCSGCGSVWTVRGAGQTCDCGELLEGTAAPGEAPLADEEEATYGLFMAPAVFGVLMALADGHADQRELDRVADFYDEADSDSLQQIRAVMDEVVRDTLAQHADVIAVAADLARDLAARLEPKDRTVLLQMMYSVAWVDRVLHPGEEALIAACQEALETPPELAAVLRCLWVTGTFGDEQDAERSRNEAFSVLDLPSGAPLAEIKQRYRRLARRYHPDKFIQMGEEFAEIATVKFKEVQAAYAVVTSEPASAQRHALCPECHELSQLPSPPSSVACSHCASAIAKATNAAWVVNCHFCGAKNRVPHSRGGATPRCGKCRVIVVFT